MGKVGKLAKLKSAITKLTKQNSTSSATASSSMISAANTTQHSYQFSNGSSSNALIPVYVGKSRRQYHLSSNIINHPLFQELVVLNDEGVTTVSCEVVLFEHLLWMLENSEESSMDDLVPFYSN